MRRMKSDPAYAILIALLILVGNASAQEGETLEEAYGRQCGNGQQNEICTVLREAMLRKLSASAAPSEANVSTSRVTVPDSATVASRWGALAILAGRAWETRSHGHRYTQYRVYEWEKVGEVMRVEDFAFVEGKVVSLVPGRADVGTISYDATSGVLRFQPTVPLAKVCPKCDGTYSVGADGSVLRFSRDWGPKRPEQVRLSSANRLELTRLKAEGAGWKATRERWEFTEFPVQASQPVSQALAAAAAAEPTKKPSRLASLIEGAAAGAEAAMSGGASGSAIAEAAVFGAAATAAGGKAEEISAAVSTATADAASAAAARADDSKSSETASANSGTATASSGGARARFKVKGNLVGTGEACRGFTMTNYRERAFVKDNNGQLNAMCGQAFEYYSMYLRAIDQGYSEADCNRTYAAHEQSARVANHYYANNR